MNVQLGDAILMTAIAVCGVAFVVSLPAMGLAVVRGSTRHGLRLAGWMLAVIAVTMAAAAWLGASARHYEFLA